MGLFTRFKRKNTALVPDDTVVVAVGDIHGDIRRLTLMLERISEMVFPEGSRKIIVFLGDYIDRGEHSCAVLDLFIQNDFLGDWEKVFLCGNHEHMLLQAFEKDHFEGWLDLAEGDKTVQSYGLRFPDGLALNKRTAFMVNFLKRTMPRTHRDFLTGLDTHFLCGDYLFVHAGIDPLKSLENQSPHDFFWIRGPFLSSRKTHAYKVVHGHSSVPKPKHLHNRIALDTGCGKGGYLSAAVFVKDTVEFVSVP